jgi:uncharacterized RDD family membrane protein YckC
MTIYCQECGSLLEEAEECSECKVKVRGSLEHLPAGEIGPLPKADPFRRLLASGAEYTAYLICKGFIGLLDWLTVGVLSLVVLVVAGFVLMRDFNGGAFNFGKRMSHMRVLNRRTGQPASNFRCFLRNSYYIALLVVAALPLIDFAPWGIFALFMMLDAMMIAASPEGLRLGDLLAGTQVVSIKRAR